MDPLFAHVTALALALLFGVSALHKARDVVGFRSVLAGYRLLPEPLGEVAILMNSMDGSATLNTNQVARLKKASSILSYRRRAVPINMMSRIGAPLK